MASKLVPERPLVFSPTLAATIGLEEAILLQVLMMWPPVPYAVLADSLAELSEHFTQSLILRYAQIRNIHR